MLGRITSLIKMQKPLRNRGLLFASGTTVPTDGTDGFQTGCEFKKTDGGVGTAFYINEGSVTSCDFNAIGSLAYVTKTHAIALTALKTGGSSAAAKDPLPDSPAGDGASLGLADAGVVVLGTSTNGGDSTEYAQFDFVVPEDYVAGNDLVVRIKSYVDVAAEATSDVDVVAKLKKGGALDGTDLCLTGAIDVKAVTAVANHDFTIDSDASGDELAPGSILNVIIALQRDDTGGSAAGTVVCDGVDVLVPCYR